MENPVRIRVVVTSAMILAAICFSGCGATEPDWNAAKQRNTVAAYDDFLSKHPRGAHVADAIAAIDGIDWSLALKANSPSDFKAFIEKHPQSPHLQEAKQLEEDTQWKSLKGSGPLTDFTNYYRQFPSSPHLQELTGDISSSPMLPFGNGIGFTVNGTVSLDIAVASVHVNGKDIGFNPPIDDAGQLGMIEYHRHGNSAEVAEKTLKNSTLIVLKGPGGIQRIVAVKDAR